MSELLANPLVRRGLGVGICFGVGLTTKKLSKARGSFVHEYLSPGLSAVASIAYTALTGEETSPEGLLMDGWSVGAGAVLAHSIFYGVRHRKDGGTQ